MRLEIQRIGQQRIRRREMLTLHRLGCSPGTVALLHAGELAFILLLGAAVAGVLLGATLWLVPNPVAWIAGP